MFNYVLFINLVDVKDGFKGVISPDLEINIVLVIFYLS
jgi:hypothetical protein